MTPSAPSPPNDSVTVGCLLGCACQAAFWILGLIAAGATLGKFSKFSALIFVSWGVTQWIALAPLIWQQRSQGYTKRVTGMIITGCVGLLLSSACGAAFVHGF